MFTTRFSTLFGIKHPIVCGCMQAITDADFVAAVANAGALGVLSSTIYGTIPALRDGIRKTKDLTDQPFAVSINLMPAVAPTNPEECIDVAIEEGVAAIETSGRSPKAYVQRIKQGNVKFMHKCARVRDTISAEKLGVDAVSVVGFECGGHPSADDVATLVMVPLAVDAVSIPVVAGGGFADGRGLVAALALGAEAVVMGTRFMATQESTAHENVKQWMLNAAESDTMIIQRSVQTNARVARTPVAEKVLAMEAQGATFEQLLPLISGASNREALLGGKLESGKLYCGESVGMVKDIPTVAALVERIMAEAVAARQKIACL